MLNFIINKHFKYFENDFPLNGHIYSLIYIFNWISPFIGKRILLTVNPVITQFDDIIPEVYDLFGASESKELSKILIIL